jgi:hypothetical protein
MVQRPADAAGQPRGRQYWLPIKHRNPFNSLLMKTRVRLAVFSVVITLGAMAWAFYISVPERAIDDIPYTAPVQESLKVKQDQSKSAFQLSLVMLAGLWATLLAKKDEKTFRFRDIPETTMFVCSNVLLLSSVCFHLDYLATVSDHLWNAGKVGTNTIPDFYNSFLNNPYSAQLVAVIGGIISTAAHLVGIHKFTPS